MYGYSSLYGTAIIGEVGHQRKKKNKPKHLRHTSKTGVSFGRKEKGLCVWAELSHSSDKRYPLPAPNRPINLKTLNPPFLSFLFPLLHPLGSSRADGECADLDSIALNCHIQSLGLMGRHCYINLCRQLAHKIRRHLLRLMPSIYQNLVLLYPFSLDYQRAGTTLLSFCFKSKVDSIQITVEPLLCRLGR